MPIDDPTRWQALSPYLDQALDIADDDERARWVGALRERDPETADGLDALLADYRAVRADGFLEHDRPLSAGLAFAGQQVGPYTLRSLIGHGGMGSVWLADRSDGRFERQAAVKFLGIALAGRGEARFRREGRILARLSHPNVAQLLDAGVSATGQPYLVLEYVQGEPVDAFCDHRRLDVAARIRLFLQILDAVAHAHASLIVHRDVKPSNVLVTHDGRVKLLDFGIATLLEPEADEHATRLTRDGGSALTLAFAAPEQMLNGAITTATDVYALGVLLFVLLTGQHPAGVSLRSQAELVKAITETDPPRASDVVVHRLDARDRDAMAAVRGTTPERLSRLLRGDLDTLIGKALKKDPLARYDGVSAFADDLRRWLAHEPIRARPDALAYRARKFARRNRAVVTLAAAVAIATVAGVVGTLLQARTAREQRDFALRQLARATALNDLNAFVLSDAAPLGKPFTVNDLLDRADRLVERPAGSPDAGRVSLLVSIGRQYGIQDQGATARRVLAKAYDWSRSIADPSIRAEAACAWGRVLAAGGDVARGEALYREGLAELPAAPQFDVDRVACLQDGSQIAREANASADAITRIQRARELLARAPLTSDLLDASTLIDLGEAYRLAGRPNDAIAVFEQVSALLTRLGRDDTQQAGTLYNNWALALNQAGRLLDAERIYRRAIAIGRDDRSEQAVSPMLLVNYARVLQGLDRRDEAADYALRGYQKALAAGDDVVVNQALLLRAAIYRDQGDFPRAVAALNEVEPRLRRSLPPTHIAFAAVTWQRALIAAARGDFDRAIVLADRVVDALQQSVDAGGEGRNNIPATLVRRADIERQLGRLDSATADATRGVQLMRSQMKPGAVSGDLGQADLILSRILLATGHRDEARREIEAALEQLQAALGPDHPSVREAHDLLAGLDAPAR